MHKSYSSLLVYPFYWHDPSEFLLRIQYTTTYYILPYSECPSLTGYTVTVRVLVCFEVLLKLCLAIFKELEACQSMMPMTSVINNFFYPLHCQWQYIVLVSAQRPRLCIKTWTQLKMGQNFCPGHLWNTIRWVKTSHRQLWLTDVHFLLRSFFT